MTTINRITDRLESLQLSTYERFQYALLAMWILAMISLPIMKWTFGEEIIPTAVTIALLFQFAAVFTILNGAWGLRASLVALVTVAVVTWGIEFVGSQTGFPFGPYEYTDRLQPQIGHVPLLIPLAWFMMMPSSWAIAQVIAGRNRPLIYIGVSALAVTAWDLFLDPQMVAWQFWQWDNPSGYFGIPWSNYAGWILTGVIITVLVRPYRFSVPLVPLLLVYGIVLFLQTTGQAIFWNQPGPALVGALGMGGLLVSAISRLRQRST
jgi:putative membrane protein